MQKLTLQPLGNADCCLIDTHDGRKILFDYANCRTDYDLPAKLREDLKAVQASSYDIVAFTHMDTDHIQGFSEFFYLLNAQKYQDGNRIGIDELWVPAAILLEKNVTGEQAILRAEACYRLKQRKGIRVFSNPDKLKDWLEKEGLNPKDFEHLITGAGQTVPGFDLLIDGVEFFVHSPFSTSIDGETIDRNCAALVMQATFQQEGQNTKVILGSDVTHDVWTDIVNVTRYYGNDEHLQWDVFKVCHHCSYLSLSSEKGKVQTEPVPNVKWLFEQGGNRGILVSSSKPIPDDDQDPQPPHRQAANYYRAVANRIDGEFKVTMEHPTKSVPAPLVILIDGSGARVEKKSVGVASIISSKPAPRAG